MNSNKSRNLIYIIILITIMGFLFSVNQVGADTSEDTINVNVTVSEKTIIDITPTYFSWTNLDPGSEGGPANETNGWGAIQIENLGSSNISYIWFNATHPSSRPFGTGANGSYDAGNFVVVKRNASNQDFYFPNRVEFNASDSIIYLNVPGGWYYGRFRNADREYFWTVNATNLECNKTTIEFRIGKDAHNQSSQGSIDLTNAANYYTATLTNDGDWGYAELNITEDASEAYCVAVKQSCDQVMFYKYNKDAPGGGVGECSNAYYFSSSTLTPGSWIIANIRVRIPYGVAYGSINQGSLTIFAQN